MNTKVFGMLSEFSKPVPPSFPLTLTLKEATPVDNVYSAFKPTFLAPAGLYNN
jgi:hypothetical protein